MPAEADLLDQLSVGTDTFLKQTTKSSLILFCRTTSSVDYLLHINQSLNQFEISQESLLSKRSILEFLPAAPGT